MAENRTELLADILSIADEDDKFLEDLVVNANEMLKRKNIPQPPSPDYDRLMDKAGRGLIPTVWETERWGYVVEESRILRAGGHSVLFLFKPYNGEIHVSADVQREYQKVGIPSAKGDRRLSTAAETALGCITHEIECLERLRTQLRRVAAGQCAVQDGD